MYSCGHNSKGERVPEYELLPPERRMPMSTGLCPKCVTHLDLSTHPELTPLLDMDKNGNVECFGWVSPIYTFNKEFLEDALDDKGDEG